MRHKAFSISSKKEFNSIIENCLLGFEEGLAMTSLLVNEIENLQEILTKDTPSIIIIDSKVGLNIISSIASKRLEVGKSLCPILVAIDSGNISEVESFLNAGVEDFIEISTHPTLLRNRIITCIKQSEEFYKLVEKSEQLSYISHAASQAGSSLIIIDKDGEIIWVNEGFELLYECEINEFREKFGKNVFDTNINPQTADSMRKCIENGEYVIYESVWYTNSNKRKNIQTSLTPIYDTNGNFSKIIAIETDITELKMVEEALNDKHDNLLSTMEHLEEANLQLDEQRREIELQKISLEEEKNKSDALLLNILPEVAAHQLKKKGFVKPKKFSEVSVVFADFVNFSSLSVAYETIEDFLSSLSFYFEAFDEITTKRFIEKIKTIGDCYMCVGGVPQINKSHPFDSVLAALEIQKLVEEKAKIDQANGKPVWRLRIGIHSGSVMAGVIGKKKFAYDIWGDTVNVASRMETKGEAGKVNISETTYNSVKDYFLCRYRGKVDAKNIGEINMYFVERILPKFSEDEEGFIPNAAFKKDLAKY